MKTQEFLTKELLYIQLFKINSLRMVLEHVAIWTNQLEVLRNYYETYYGGKSNLKYANPKTSFESYFLVFDSGARLELMQMPGVPENKNDRVQEQHLGIIHLAFGVDRMEDVEEKAEQLGAAGFPILRGPRKTGDGYYEFETLDPDQNRIEVTTVFRKK